MNKKLLHLHKKTLLLIQHSIMRVAELTNILTIIDIWSKVKNCTPIIRVLEKRLQDLEKKPGFAGKHEEHKIHLKDL